MDLWISWWSILRLFRPAFSRAQTFFWFVLVVAAFSVRTDLRGVTSFIRALCLHESNYDALLNFFHSSAVKVELLAQLWFRIVVTCFPVHRVDGQLLLILDGLKKSKEGKKMPAVKYLHQASESNTKPHFIMGHSFQGFGILCSVAGYYFSVPVCARIHEGIVLSNRDKRTLIDKANEMLNAVCQGERFLLIADAYYGNGKTIRRLREQSRHLITRLRRTTIAYHPAPAPPKAKRGRPRKYGKRVKLSKLFLAPDTFACMRSPVYGENNVRIRYRVLDLLWKPAGAMMRFVLVDHPLRGRVILMTTDLTKDAREIIFLYGLRFKIEVCFKHALHSVGVFGYHFWMAGMHPLKRRSGNQYLHRESSKYRRQVLRKLHAYHVYVQCGMIAQGMLQYLAMVKASLVWNNFGSWIRTIRPEVLPSEMIVGEALKNTLPDFLRFSKVSESLTKFLLGRIDFTRRESSRFAA